MNFNVLQIQNAQDTSRGVLVKREQSNYFEVQARCRQRRRGGQLRGLQERDLCFHAASTIGNAVGVLLLARAWKTWQHSGLLADSPFFWLPTHSPLRLPCHPQPGKVVVVLSGRFAGKKAVIVKNHDDGTSTRPYGHALLVGLQKEPRKGARSCACRPVGMHALTPHHSSSLQVTKRQNQKKQEKKCSVKVWQEGWTFGFVTVLQQADMSSTHWRLAPPNSEHTSSK
eukprot:627463-Pelagomonas_calceolata.AAC.1